MSWARPGKLHIRRSDPHEAPNPRRAGQPRWAGARRPAAGRRPRPHRQRELRQHLRGRPAGQQNITFKTADTLTAEEKQQACLVSYAGQKLTTGKQAECYANNFIGLHLQGHRRRQDLRRTRRRRRPQLRTQIADAQKTNAPNLADLQKQLTDATASRETVFKGETLRGLLLTSYGFSEFGTKAGQAATVAYVAAGLVLLLALLGLLHAYRTPKSTAFAATAAGHEAEPTRQRLIQQPRSHNHIHGAPLRRGPAVDCPGLQCKPGQGKPGQGKELGCRKAVSHVTSGGAVGTTDLRSRSRRDLRP